MLICSRCKESKPESSFSRNRSKKRGFQDFCRECQKTVKDSHYQRKKPVYFKKVALYRKRLSLLVVSLKEGKSCMDCGVAYPPWVMDFDHRPGTKKVINVSQICKRGSERQIYEEIAKCDLVCSNCHRQRTHSRARSSNGRATAS